MMKRAVFFLFLLGSLTPLMRGAESKQFEPDLVAVHDFSVSPAIEKLKISGWWVAERMENELVQSGRYRIVTRAKIAKVLKEQNITSVPTLKPQELGKMVGAQYIVTGQVDYSGGAIELVVTMIDTANKKGEIRSSFDVDMPCAEKDVGARLPELIEELAKKLSMSPGEILDEGLKYMKEGDFEAAVQSFNDFSRCVDLARINALTEMVSEKHHEERAAQLAIPGKTPGEMLDYGMDLMRKGDLNQASLVFYHLQKSKMAQMIRNLMQVAKDGAKKKEETIGKLLTEARKKFENAIVSRDDKEKRRDPTALCDEAITMLQAFLSNPGMQLSPGERRKIETLISEIEAFRKKLFAGPTPEREWVVPGVKIELVPVKPGSFTTRPDGPKEDALEHPYTARITRPFWMGKYEVTAGQFQYYLKSLGGLNRNDRYEVEKEIDFEAEECPLSPSYQLKRGFKADMPMAFISWRSARDFCGWLTRQEREAGRLPEGYEYRLPTEGEWEYCCRAGTATAYSFGDSTQDMEKYAWYRSNTAGKSQSSGGKEPNAWGIYDMHGNVWEWCNDWYNDTFLVADVENPVGPESSSDNLKVARGGSFASDAADLQSGSRYCYDYKSGKKNIGFRIVCAPEL